MSPTAPTPPPAISPHACKRSETKPSEIWEKSRRIEGKHFQAEEQISEIKIIHKNKRERRHRRIKRRRRARIQIHPPCTFLLSCATQNQCLSVYIFLVRLAHFFPSFPLIVLRVPQRGGRRGRLTPLPVGEALMFGPGGGRWGMEGKGGKARGV